MNITDDAADKIKEILKVEGVPEHALRVMVSSGCGCGPSYEIMIDEKPGDGDTVVEKNGARLILDASTAKTLDGAELQFVSDERGEGFAIGFPNGAPMGGSCGCGDDSGPSAGGCGSGGCSCG